MVNYYPIFLDLRAKPVLVAGGGTVALRKTKGLLEAGARVTIIAPEVLDELRARAVTVVERKYLAGDCAGYALVFAATNSREVNAQIGREAAGLGIPANIADAAEECGFIVPARFSDHGVQVAVSTGGVDPRRAVAIRDRIRELFQSSKHD
ncbi:MAG TPA: bifunctional precorrin-2 dehydrogenase/sirohydrochlorin ferrochelatase [Bryobacteraceae bacterium]